jgi:hypothetical protein
MDISDLSTNRAADKYLVGIPHRARERENLATTRVRPPTPADRLARDRSSK